MSDAHLTERPLDRRPRADRPDRGADPAEQPGPGGDARRRGRRPVPAAADRARRPRWWSGSPAPGCWASPAGGWRSRRTPELATPDHGGRPHPRRQRAGQAAPPTTCAADWPPTSSWTAASAPSTATRRDDKRSVLLFGGTTLLWQPERDLDSLFRLMADETGGVTGLREVPAGARRGDEVRHHQRRRAATSRSAAGPTTAAW